MAFTPVVTGVGQFVDECVGDDHLVPLRLDEPDGGAVVPTAAIDENAPVVCENRDLVTGIE